MGTKRIDLSLFDDNLKGLINASAKIFPMSLSDVQANLNPNLYEYARIIDTGPRKNEIYIWTNSVFELIGADDKTVLWTDVQSKPLSYPNDLAHTHSNMTLINTITQVMFDTWTTAVTHISDVVKHITGVERTAWNGKADGIHTHVKANITDFPIIPTDTNQLTKTDVYTKTEVTTSLALKSDAIHDHDGRYNTKAEITSALGGKSDITHDHNLVYAVKSTEGTVSSQGTLITGLRTDVNANTNSISTIQTNMANGDMHSNIGILNQLTQILLDNWNSAVTHISDAVKHITGAERISWNAKSNFSGVYTDLTSKPVIPTTTSALTNDSTFQTALQVTTSISGKADKSYVDAQDATKVDSTTFNGHANNSTIHVLQTDKDNWNAKIGSGGGTINGELIATKFTIANSTGLVKVGYYGTISETAGGSAYITGNNIAAFGTNTVAKTASTADFAQFMRMRYDKGISFHTGISGTVGVAQADDINTRLTIDLFGRVGIGKTPAEILDVAGNVKATGMILGSNLTGTNTGDQDLSGYVKIVQGTVEPISTAYWFKEV